MDCAQKLDIEGRPRASGTVLQQAHHFMTTSITRLLHMLFTEPIVGFLYLYAAFDFRLLYIFVVASPSTYAEVYGFNLNQQGLSFVGFIVGAMVASLPAVILVQCLHQHQAPADPEAKNLLTPPAPEHRLYAAMLGSLLLPVGLFWYGWTMRPDIHWSCPMVAQGVAILGAVDIYIAANLCSSWIHTVRFTELRHKQQTPSPGTVSRLRRLCSLCRCSIDWVLPGRLACLDFVRCYWLQYPGLYIGTALE